MSNTNTNLAFNYLSLRKAIGMLGFFLPIILVIGNLVFSNCKNVQSSISMYYYTYFGDVFVGIMFAISVFLFNYEAYDWQDKIAGKLASVAGFAVAFFPANSKNITSPCLHEIIKNNKTFGLIHTISAVTFFIILAYFCLCLFTKSKVEFNKQTEQKKIRNVIYQVCGYSIIALLMMMAVLKLFPNINNSLKEIHPLLVLETLVLWAFGISWLVKGEFILKDIHRSKAN